MTAPTDATVLVTDDAEAITYVFADEADHEAWALRNEPTWQATRLATPDELAAAAAVDEAGLL